MDSATIIIDDHDPRVSYIGSWAFSGSSSEYLQTTSTSNVVGDYLMVNFHGSSISVYGTLNPNSAGSVASFTVDGSSPAQVTARAVSGVVYRQNFWVSPGLGPGNHQLVVKIIGASGNASFWFDYFSVEDTDPGADLPVSSSSQTVIDDRDPRIRYAGGVWYTSGSEGEYDQTTSLTNITGATLTLPFQGTSIGVYGTYDTVSVGIVSGYSVDGAPATKVTVPNFTSVAHSQLFWASPTLQAGNHNLVVTMVSYTGPAGTAGTIWFDYFIVMGPAGVSSTSTQTPISLVSTTLSTTGTISSSSSMIRSNMTASVITMGLASSTTATIDPLLSSPTLSQNTNRPDTTAVSGFSGPQRHATSTKIIVGSAVGGVIGLILVLVLCFCCRKWRCNLVRPSQTQQTYYPDQDGAG